jgi:diguanylate cyclase (GGDEF)-like protein
MREAIAIAERLRLKVTQESFERGQNAAPVTLSIGVAAMVPDMANGSELFRRADQALLEAKRLGRNRTRSVPHDAGARRAAGS